jgi:hypothetical protein
MAPTLRNSTLTSGSAGTGGTGGGDAVTGNKGGDGAAGLSCDRMIFASPQPTCMP